MRKVEDSKVGIARLVVSGLGKWCEEATEVAVYGNEKKPAGALRRYKSNEVK